MVADGPRHLTQTELAPTSSQKHRLQAPVNAGLDGMRLQVVQLRRIPHLLVEWRQVEWLPVALLVAWHQVGPHLVVLHLAVWRQVASHLLVQHQLEQRRWRWQHQHQVRESVYRWFVIHQCHQIYNRCLSSYPASLFNVTSWHYLCRASIPQTILHGQTNTTDMTTVFHTFKDTMDLF